MSAIGVVAAVAGGLALLALVAWLVRSRSRVADAVIVTPAGSTVLGGDGAVRSVQAADLTLPAEDLEAIWTPMHLERLARTYWRFLARVTLGLIRVEYTPAERGCPTRFNLVIRLPDDLPEEQVEKLRIIAAKCPVHRTLDGEVMFDERVERVSLAH